MHLLVVGEEELAVMSRGTRDELRAVVQTSWVARLLVWPVASPQIDLVKHVRYAHGAVFGALLQDKLAAENAQAEGHVASRFRNQESFADLIFLFSGGVDLSHMRNDSNGIEEIR